MGALCSTALALALCAHVVGAPLEGAQVVTQRLQEVAANLPKKLVGRRVKTPGAELVNIDGSTAHHTLSKSFICFTMDASSRSSYTLALWEDTQLQALARHLGPSILRFGGIAQDFTAYAFERSDGADPCDDLEPLVDEMGSPECALLRSELLKGISDFTKSAGWDLVLGLNFQSARDAATGEWSPAELNKLLYHSGPDRANVSFYGLELGNEPDIFCKSPDGSEFRCSHPPEQERKDPKVVAVTPQQAASDFHQFRERLQKVPKDRRPKAIGNDISKDMDYTKAFLDALTEPLDVFTYHFYCTPAPSPKRPLAPCHA